jgi:surface polysaccharide O-acyltransferase-like enzyme
MGDGLLPADDTRRALGRSLYLDVLRILATFAVVIIHNTTYINYGAVQTINWWAADVLNSLCRWSVPVFFMISGATLLTFPQRYSTPEFYRKRFVKVVVPFLIWTVIYLVWGVQVHTFDLTGPRDLYARTIGGPAFPHLWFFYVLFGLYLVTPILAVVVSAGTRPLVYGLITLCFLQNALFPLSLRFLGVGVGFSIPLAAPFLGYYLLGWTLKDLRPGRLTVLTVSLVAALGIAVTVVTSYYLSVGASVPDVFYMTYESVATYAGAVAVFVIARAVPWEHILRDPRSRATVTQVAGMTFGVYLVHILVRYYLMQWTGAQEYKVVFMTLGSVVVFAASVAVVAVLRRIPVVRVAVPG